MSENVAVKWCPQCASWIKCTMIGESVVCGFVWTNALKAIVYNSFEKPYLCGSCGEGFTTSESIPPHEANCIPPN